MFHRRWKRLLFRAKILLLHCQFMGPAMSRRRGECEGGAHHSASMLILPARADRGGLDVLLGLRTPRIEELQVLPRQVGCGIAWTLDGSGHMIVSSIMAESPASLATPRIMKGDILLSIEGIEVPKNCAHYMSEIATQLVGPENSTVTLGLCRFLIAQSRVIGKEIVLIWLHFVTGPWRIRSTPRSYLTS